MNADGADLFLVFTDLDGSLLDHHTYSYRDAVPQLHRLEHRGIPVIPASSKTRAEIEVLRDELGNHHPFIAENGAAVYIPRGYFATRPPDTVERDAYWVREWSPSREHWLDVLASLSTRFEGEFENFFEAGSGGIARMTGLTAEQAELANQREYSEPVKWLGSPEQRAQFIECLREAGCEVLQGCRFLSMSGPCDKGRALCWLREAFAREHPGRTIQDLAAGDSGNDLAMLNAAGTALLVRSPVHAFPDVDRRDGVLRSVDYGPAGWAEGVARWLETRGINNGHNG